jgi:hypothetical protein
MDTQELAADPELPNRGASEEASARPKSGLAAALQKVGLRRQYIVNARRQYRSAILVALVAMVPVAMLNVILHLSRVFEREALFASASPDLAQQLAAFDRSEMWLVMAASVVFVVGVFVMTLLETHQTSGAAIGIARHLGQIRDGRYDTRLRLRNTDNLTELVEPFNDMAAALADRAVSTAERMDELAVQAEGLAGGARLAAQLRELSFDHASLSERRS